MSTDDDDDRVLMVPDDLPEGKRLQYADLERRYRVRLREIAGLLATQRGLGAWLELPPDNAGALIADAQILVKDWDPERTATAANLTEIERIVADCREISEQMMDLVEYVIGPQ